VSRGRLRVAVLYNAPTLSPDHPDYASEAGVVAAARAVAVELKGRGLKAWPMAARPPVARLVRSLSRRKPQVVFNLIEGFGGRAAGEAWITSLLEMMGLPYTGCPPEAQGLCRHKARTKALLLGSGLPTAPYWLVRPGDELPAPSGPVIVKPESEDASLGLDRGSVVDSIEALAVQVAKVQASHGPNALVEAYLPGPEYNVGVLALPEPEALPVAEVLYQSAAGPFPILTYTAKWAVGSEQDLASPVRCPAEIDAGLAGLLGRLAVSAFQATGCRDYARVDLRLDDQGRPMILEVNPNPDLDPSAGLARALRVAGRDYGDLLEALVRQARERRLP
jgi:D-alanine-D-alanine ligase